MYCATLAPHPRFWGQKTLLYCTVFWCWTEKHRPDVRFVATVPKSENKFVTFCAEKIELFLYYTVTVPKTFLEMFGIFAEVLPKL